MTSPSTATTCSQTRAPAQTSGPASRTRPTATTFTTCTPTSWCLTTFAGGCRPRLPAHDTPHAGGPPGRTRDRQCSAANLCLYTRVHHVPPTPARVPAHLECDTDMGCVNTRTCSFHSANGVHTCIDVCHKLLYLLCDRHCPGHGTYNRGQHRLNPCPHGGPGQWSYLHRLQPMHAHGAPVAGVRCLGQQTLSWLFPPCKSSLPPALAGPWGLASSA